MWKSANPLESFPFRHSLDLLYLTTLAPQYFIQKKMEIREISQSNIRQTIVYSEHLGLKQ